MIATLIVVFADLDSKIIMVFVNQYAHQIKLLLMENVIALKVN